MTVAPSEIHLRASFLPLQRPLVHLLLPKMTQNPIPKTRTEWITLPIPRTTRLDDPKSGIWDKWWDAVRILQREKHIYGKMTGTKGLHIQES